MKKELDSMYIFLQIDASLVGMMKICRFESVSETEI